MSVAVLNTRLIHVGVDLPITDFQVCVFCIGLLSSKISAINVNHTVTF